MPKRLLQDLHDIANQELPLLKGDLQNASTLFALQAAAQRLHTIQEYLVHALLLTIHKVEGNPIPMPPPAAPPPQRQVMPPQRQFGSAFVPPGPRQQPQPQPRIMDVTITPNGTQVNVPGLPPATFVPGEAARLDFDNLPSPMPPLAFGAALSPFVQPHQPMGPQGVPMGAMPIAPGTPVGGTQDAPAEVFLPRGGAEGNGQVLVVQPQGARDITQG